ncbi:MAG: RIP metalloprotease RseP [Candidatus Omnitrophota bacterium]
MDIAAFFQSLKSLIVFAAVLSILIIVHEWGHFITAKKLGVRVERFALGFGPKLFSWMYRGTQMRICLIPLGGYVKMAGDERSECKGQPDEFYSQSPGRRALIILNGPVVNFILAYLCLLIVFVSGYPDLPAKIGEVMEGYPAQAAGLAAGDQIIRINSFRVDTWTDVQKNIATSQEPAIRLVVLRNNQEMPLTLTPRRETLKNIFGQTENINIAGIRPTEEIVLLRYGLGESILKSFYKLHEITVLTYKAIYHMATGSMSAKDSMTGPIGIFFIIKRAAEMGFSYLVYILGVISASLAIFNLLPVVPLDGGHLLLLGVEKIRGKVLSEKIDEIIARVGFSLVICLAIFVFYNDFSRLGWIDKILNLWR